MRDQDVLDSFAISCGFEIIGMDHALGALDLLLRRILGMLDGHTDQVSSIAFDLDTVGDQKTVLLSLALLHQKLAVVHAGLQWEGPHLLKAGVDVVLPCDALVDIAEVLVELRDGDLTEVGFKASVVRLARIVAHAKQLDSIARLLLKLPVCTVKQVDEFVGRLTPNLHVHHCLFI